MKKYLDKNRYDTTHYNVKNNEIKYKIFLVIYMLTHSLFKFLKELELGNKWYKTITFNKLNFMLIILIN